MRIRSVVTASKKHAIQVVSKVRGCLKIHKHIGTYSGDEEKGRLLSLAQEYIRKEIDQCELFTPDPTTWRLNEVEVVSSHSSYLYQLLSLAYDQLGFTGDPLIRDLVIARLYQPSSKRETRQILSEVFAKDYSLTTVYRHLKKTISKGLKTQYQTALVNFAKGELGDDLRLVFYDVTTLAFATQTRTELKDFGYSKDHRSQDAQVVVGLVVNRQGFPLYFDVFSGNTFEGGTFVQVVGNVKKLLACPDLVVVADAGMLSQKNMDELEREGILFVVGARISSLSLPVIGEIVKQLGQLDGATTEISHKQYRLLADYSAKRAKKDLYDLTKQWEKAQKALTKPDGVTRRYRFLRGSKRASFVLNTKLKEKAEMIAGIKGYITNTKLDAMTIITRYHDLWKVEKAFRMTKSDLRARPIFLRLNETIKAHLTIVFAGLAIAKLLEFQTDMSIHQIIQTTSRIFTHTIRNTTTGETTTIQTKIPDTDLCGKLDRIYHLGTK